MKLTIYFTFFLIFLSFLSFSNKLQADEYTIISDEEVEKALNIPLLDHWFGLYFIEEENAEYKLGFMHEKEIFKNSYLEFNESVYIYDSNVNFTMDMGEVIITYEILSQYVFQTQQPYNLLYYEQVVNDGNSNFTTTSTKKNNSLITKKLDSNTIEEKITNNFDFTLNHWFAAYYFYENPRSHLGEKIKILDFADGELNDLTWKFLEIKKTQVEGVPYEYYIFESTYTWDDETLIGIDYMDTSFNIIKTDIPSMQIEARLETKEQAIDLSNLSNLFVLNSINIKPNLVNILLDTDQNTYINNIYFEIEGNYNNLFTTSYEQEVFYQEGSNYLALGYDQGVFEEATIEDIKKNLEKKDFDPIDDNTIINLAFQATNGATTLEKKVENLISFVSEYIEDDLSIGNISSVYDIIKIKKGDCTEHSYFFNTLARSIGIPSREVIGYAFDPENNTYSGHAWNEVVIDGYWYPVDPTWNEFLPSITHIKTNENKELVINDISLKLVKIEYDNGEERFF